MERPTPIPSRTVKSALVPPAPLLRTGMTEQAGTRPCLAPGTARFSPRVARFRGNPISRTANQPAGRRSLAAALLDSIATGSGPLRAIITLSPLAVRLRRKPASKPLARTVSIIVPAINAERLRIASPTAWAAALAAAGQTAPDRGVAPRPLAPSA